MATANELFRDALLRRQITLAQLERGTQVEVLKLLDATEREIRAELQDRLAGLAGKKFGPTTTSRLNVLANSLQRIRESAFEEVGTVWNETMSALSVDEVKYLDDALHRVMPVTVDTVLPAANVLGSLVDNIPVKGRVLAEWAETVASADVSRIMDGVRIGVLNGEAADDIVRRILGTKALDGSDGVLEFARRDLASITQTAISTITNEARSLFYQENDDVFNEEMWTATLDDTTCEECGSLDGQTFPIGKGQKPPAHFNCRCVRVPVIGGKLAGARPANAATERALEGLEGRERTAKIRELVGQVPAETRYADWLKSQSTSFQDHVLGPNRAALFRDGGLTLDKFVNHDGKTLNLEQLRKLHPGAFDKAGL